MFARLTGKIDEILENAVILDVGGVGYLVTCSARTLSRMDGPGAFLRLYIETHVREDAINLYGFMDADEQAWFKLLTTVQGVGARVAMSILGTAPASELALAIAAQDKTAFTRADGVGPKLGTRIVTELSGKVPEAMMMSMATPVNPARGASVKAQGNAPSATSADSDAVSALVNLCYARAEAFSAVMKVRADYNGDKAGDLIRLALGELGRSAA